MKLLLILLFLLRLSTRFESSLLLGWAIDTAEATPIWRWILNYKPPHKQGRPKMGWGIIQGDLGKLPPPLNLEST
jgi:hypothetical protein